MKLHAEDRNVVRGGELVETEFHIKNTAKAFGILSSGLYGNKIRAIIRELCCNAYDAHVAAGKKDIPIEVKLPSALDPTFYVKDFGIGLDHQGVTKLYTTYFESTKADSNDFIGALGLGSKSPFSYTQSFSVEARYNGMKRFYTAFINEGGIPAIVKMSENETDEENGLTVSLQVKNEDITKFYEEARYVLMYFNPLPAVKGRHGFVPYELKHTLEGNGWKVRTAEYSAYMYGAYIVQGFVPYPIDKTVMNQNNLSKNAATVLEMNIDISVNMGDVEVAASREALSYTKQTIANIKARLEQIAEEMSTTIQQQIDTCPTLWEARMKYVSLMMDKNTIVRNMFRSMRDTKGFTWRGKKLREEVMINVDNVDHTDIAIMYKTRGRKNLSRMKGYEAANKRNYLISKTQRYEFELTLVDNLTVIIDDVNGATDIVRQWLDAAPQGGDRDEQRVIILRPIHKNVVAESKKEIAHLVREFGDVNALLASTLGFEKKKVKSYYVSKKRAKSELNVWTGFPTNGGYRKDQLRRVFSRQCWKTTEIDLAKGGWCVLIDRFTILGGGADGVTMFDRIVSNAETLGLLPEDVTIVGMNDKEYAIAQKQGKWVNVLEHIPATFHALNKNNALLLPWAASNLMSDIGKGLFTNIIARLPTVGDEINHGSFKTLMTDIRGMCNKDVNISAVTSLVDYLNFKAERQIVTNIEKEVKARWMDVRKKYEMLSLIDWLHIEQHHVPLVINYVNTIDKPAK